MVVAVAEAVMAEDEAVVKIIGIEIKMVTEASVVIGPTIITITGTLRADMGVNAPSKIMDRVVTVAVMIKDKGGDNR